MAKRDAFDLIPQENQSPADSPGPVPEPPPRNWLWLLMVALVGLLAFGAGAAIFTMRDRLGGDAPPTVSPFATTTPTSQLPGWISTTVAALVTPSPTATTQAVTPSPQSTPSATPSPTPPCTIPVAAAFSAIYSEEIFGCALSAGQLVWAAWEPFERGSMLWRSDDNRAYVFYPNGSWGLLDATWDGQTVDGRGDPPQGLSAPERGFGWVWSTRDDIFANLGWALSAEQGFCADVQEFAHGFLLQSNPASSCTQEGLYNFASTGEWQPLVLAVHEDGRWSGVMSGAAVASPAPTRTLNVAGRPEENGVFQAVRLSAPQLDGSFGEWPGNWTPINVAVEGVANYSGPLDGYGFFQVAWSPQALYLAVRVEDELHRAGPAGTDLWQGDAIELQFDRWLVDDYADTTANEDDFQLGVSVGPNQDRIALYRWLPRSQEGELATIGVALPSERGYDVELVVPWSYLGVDEAASGQSYGFNLSISDNDSDTPAQQTVLSASPARTTFDNPSEWGTLVLMP